MKELVTLGIAQKSGMEARKFSHNDNFKFSFDFKSDEINKKTLIKKYNRIPNFIKFLRIKGRHTTDRESQRTCY